MDTTKDMKHVLAKQVPATEPEIYVQIPVRKYRAHKYDIHDETYAKELSTYSLPEEFHTFTERLMYEPRMNRFALLRAIDDYKQAGLPALSIQFQDTAFNFRTHQACVIC